LDEGLHKKSELVTLSSEMSGILHWNENDFDSAYIYTWFHGDEALAEQSLF
jgi:hypothetical protein